MRRILKATVLLTIGLSAAACGPQDEATPEAATGSATQAVTVEGAGAPGRGGLETPQVRRPAPGLQMTEVPADLATTGTPRADRPKGPVVTPVDERLVGVLALADDFPWGKGEDGNWQGTGSPDPEPLQKISNEEILATARGDKGSLDDRRSAVVSAARRHLPGALDAAAAILFDGSLDLLTRQIGLSALIEHGGAGALSLMWRAQQDSHERIRGGAIWAIALYGTEEAKKAITAGMKDPAAGVRGMAVLALTAVRDDEVFIRTTLEKALASSEQQEYQEAGYVLAALADTRAVKALSDALDASTGNDLKRRTLRHYLRAAYQKRAAAGAVAFPN